MKKILKKNRGRVKPAPNSNHDPCRRPSWQPLPFCRIISKTGILKGHLGISNHEKISEPFSHSGHPGCIGRHPSESIPNVGEEAGEIRVLREPACDPVLYERIRFDGSQGCATPEIDRSRPLYLSPPESPKATDEAAAPKWKPLSGEVKGMAANPGKPGEIFLLVSSSYSSASQIYRSTKSGGKWKKASTIFRNSYDIVLEPGNPRTVYELGDNERLKSTDTGRSWTGINKGLSMANVLCLASNSAKYFLFAGTTGGGVYRCVISSLK
jgi:hypothetical protein